ncbi:MAG: membrane protein insertase YidC [Gammaproteobacteria bacterium]|jgi:YidC/Oxa1 family membrane protein insertase|nr:membrane protein insertase YidC [Gammaproteobacteria bacterium]MDH3863607.1 membrane protein insertase YidC [Gammaproteobacteria bacterium]MDH3904035.1 membrane protein insertase YidC [Gammaproteobacteria bacterium]MDH3952797.1 membrane protein insertase YidC [Gammaproteobacteria bacterium]MDH4004058.1 membrane protein insertase YidC [Gammaproteobacteria bacterium]
MDNQRLLVWAAFGVLLWLAYQTWMQDYGPAPVPVTQPADTEQATATPAEEQLALPELGETVDQTEETGATLPGSEPADAPGQGTTIIVRTDVLKLLISTRGGTLVRATLLGYPIEKDRPNDLVELLSPERSNLGLIRTGLRSSSGASADHEAVFSSARSEYTLGDDDELVVPLTWTDESGVSIEKRFVFTRGSYAIRIEQTLSNDSAEPWRGDQYTQLLRRSKGMDRSMFDVDSYSFDGPQTYNGDKAEKFKRDDLEDKGPVEYSTPDGWVAAIQHHFLSAIIPEAGAPHVYRVEVKGDTMIASVVGGKRTVEAGAAETFSRQLFVGPKVQSQLGELHERLKLTVDYGWLTILSQPMFWLLAFIYGYVGNWGVSIILVTVLIKLAFYKMTETSGRSMAKMRNLQPRIKALQERYKDDRQQLSQQMMDLYKREQVNPAAGCLPILIQMPFFLSFYWVLIESVEMRQAPFALWITDLSTRDPYFILPLIMGAAMLLQQKLNPAPADPVQARVMQIMPIMFTGFFAFFPSGLVLYWATNTVLSIAQQWKINRVVEQEEKNRKSGKKKKTKEK